MASRKPQQEMVFRTHGGKRKGAGRKPKIPGKPGVSHKARDVLSDRLPVHVTLKVRGDVPNLRRNALLVPLTDALRAGRERFGFRLCHYVIMGNHLHLIVEADDEQALSRGLQGLCIRLARRANTELGRRGKLFGDRYHAHVLRTPTEVHRALSYVLLNYRKHVLEKSSVAPRGLDGFSSAPWFTGWQPMPRGAERLRTGDPPVAQPRAWLLTEGWKRVGTISIDGSRPR